MNGPMGGNDVVAGHYELVDGGSLQTLLGDWGPLDEPTVVALLDQLRSALAVMHDAGLVHRDVKPGNVLHRATGEGALHCLLTDFGSPSARTNHV